MKINKKYYHVVMASIMAFLMGGCMSGIVTFINIGWVDDFFQRWANAFGFVFVIALPLTLIFTPLAARLANKVTAS